MKVCFVGSGSIGKRHINNLQKICKEKGISLETVLFRSTNSPLDGISFDKQVFSEKELGEAYDMIFITNPTFLHFDTLKMLHDKSDYFFVEKPVFDNTDVDFSFIAKNKLIYVACPLRHLNVIRNMGKYVDLEKVFSVRSICSTYLPDWRPGIDYRKNYSAHADAGGGVRIDLIHEWDYLTALFGFPDKVYSISSTISELEIDSEDIAVYIAQLQTLFNQSQSSMARKLISQDIQKANQFINEGVSDVEFYFLFKEKNDEIIQKRIRLIINGLAGAGLASSQANNEDLRMILDSFLNGGEKSTFGTVMS